MITKIGEVVRENYLFPKIKIRYSFFLIFLLWIITGCGKPNDYISNTMNNKSGELQWEWVIEANEYVDISFVSENLLVARTDSGKSVLLTLNGDIVLPDKYDSISRFNEGIALIKEGEDFLFINEDGKEVGEGVFQNAFSFSESLAAVQKDGVWGYIDETGKLVIAYQYDEVKSFAEGLAAVKKDDKWGFINTKGELIIPCQFDMAKSFCEGKSVVVSDGEYGVVDKVGNVIVECRYEEIRDFREGYAAIKQNNKWGFVNQDGQVAIDIQYDDVHDFSEGKAAVFLKENNEGMDEWAYIDSQENIVIDFYPYEASEGRRILVGDFENGIAFVSKTLYCIIDDRGNDIFLGNSDFFISSPLYNQEYEVIPGYVFSDNQMTVKKYGLMNLYGETRVEPVFDYIGEMEGKYVIVSMIVDGNYKEGVIELIYDYE